MKPGLISYLHHRLLSPSAAQAGIYLWYHSPTIPPHPRCALHPLHGRGNTEQTENRGSCSSQKMKYFGSGGRELQFLLRTALWTSCARASQQGGGNTWPGGKEAETWQCWLRSAHAAMASHFPLQYSGHRTNLYQFTYKVQGMINLMGTIFIVGAYLRTESPP